MLPALILFFQRICNYLEVFFIAQEIGIAGIYKQRFYVVLFYIIGIGLLYIEKLLILYSLLIRTISFFNILLQFLHRRMQVDQYIRLRQLLVDDLE